MPADQKEKKVAFLPFHAINEFMTEEYRLQVISDVLTALSDVPENYRNQINQLTRKHVNIPGFRNSLKAPLPLRIKFSARGFEKNPYFVAAVLAAWAEIQHELREKVHNLLQLRQWEILPLDADRTKLPGFLTIWPGGENFEVLNQAFQEMHPDFNATSDNVSLMIIWISGRLPYQFSDGENDR